MEMNVKLLRKVKKHILAHPSKMDMNTYIDGEGCGTTACIAGWACVLTGNTEPYNPHSKATELLGISDRQSNQLFYDCDWPEGLYDRFYTAKSARTRAKIAAERIEHFISTKGAE